VTDSLGLVTLLIAAVSAMAILEPELADEVGDSAPLLTGWATAPTSCS